MVEWKISCLYEGRSLESKKKPESACGSGGDVAEVVGNLFNSERKTLRLMET